MTGDTIDAIRRYTQITNCSLFTLLFLYHIFQIKHVANCVSPNTQPFKTLISLFFIYFYLVTCLAHFFPIAHPVIHSLPLIPILFNYISMQLILKKRQKLFLTDMLFYILLILTNSLCFKETFLQTIGLLFLIFLRLYWGNRHIQILEISNINIPFI